MTNLEHNQVNLLKDDIEISESIVIKGFNLKIIKFLKQNNITYDLWRTYKIEEVSDKFEDENAFIPIPKKAFLEIEKLCKINHLNPYQKILDILDTEFQKIMNY